MSEHTSEPWNDKKYVDRFWSRVDIRGEDDCWEWKRGLTVQGYGCFHFGNSSIRAHRFSYQQHNGAIREHECVCHSCDNPKCVNPAHLWIGTRSDNNADKESKGRAVYPNQGSGELNSNFTLTTPEVIAARVMARKGMPQAYIASFLGVSNATICMIVNNQRRAEESEQRVSCCVNACSGLDTDSLEMMVMVGDTLKARFESRRPSESQRDKLLAALKSLVAISHAGCTGVWDDARNVIAEIESEL